MLFHALNLVAAAAGVPTQPCMRNPLLSSSLRDFWAHRWNLPTSESLRVSCYTPLVSLLSPAPANPDPSTAGTNGDATGQVSDVAPTPSTHTLSHRGGASNGRSAVAAAGGDAAASAVPKRKRTARARWVAFAGLSLAFFLSGAVHHWLMSLFTKADLRADCRFAVLFWIQPPMIVGQEAWMRSRWWRGVKARAPRAAWCALPRHGGLH